MVKALFYISFSYLAGRQRTTLGPCACNCALDTTLVSIFFVIITYILL